MNPGQTPPTGKPSGGSEPKAIRKSPPAASRHGLNALMRAAAHCPDEAAIRDLCQKFCAAIQHDGWLLACSLPHLKVSEVQIPHLSFSGYDSAWIARYNARGYFGHDPVVKQGLTAYRPFDWSEIDDSSPAAAELFADAAQYGICGGFSAPLRGPYAARGLINFSRPHSRPLDANRNTSVQAAALYFGTLLMESVVRVAETVSAELSRGAAELPGTDLHLLQGLLAGQAESVLAGQLKLSTVELRRRIGRIQKKLRCESHEQLLARAPFLDLTMVESV